MRIYPLVCLNRLKKRSSRGISETSGSGFGSSLTLTQSSGSVSDADIYVRLNRATAGTSSGNITFLEELHAADDAQGNAEEDDRQEQGQCHEAVNLEAPGAVDFGGLVKLPVDRLKPREVNYSYNFV